MVEGILVAVGIVALATLIWAVARASRPRFAQRQQTVEIPLVLLNLVQDLQLHRGLSGAVLAGQTDLNGELDACGHKLERSLYALADQYGERQPIFKSPQWRTVLGRWESLRNNWRELDFHTNLLVHSELVTGLTGILRSFAADHADRLGADRSQMLATWPTLIEHLGMLRGLGMCLLSSRDEDPATPVHASLADYLQRARQALATIADTVNDHPTLVTSERALRRVAWLLDGNAGRYHTYPFYEEMTAVIDGWYRLISTRMLAECRNRSARERLATYARIHLKPG